MTKANKIHGYVSCPTSSGYELDQIESVSYRGLKQQASKLFHITDKTKLYLYNDDKQVIAHKVGFNNWVDHSGNELVQKLKDRWL